VLREAAAQVGIRQDARHGVGETRPVAVDQGVASVPQRQAAATRGRGDNRFPAGHGLQYLDVGAGRDFERHGHGCSPGVDGAEIFDEAVDLHARVGVQRAAPGREALPARGMARTRHHAHHGMGAAAPHTRHHLIAELLETHHVRQMAERADIEDLGGRSRVGRGREADSIDSVGDGECAVGVAAFPNGGGAILFGDGPHAVVGAEPAAFVLQPAVILAPRLPRAMTFGELAVKTEGEIVLD